MVQNISANEESLSDLRMKKIEKKDFIAKRREFLDVESDSQVGHDGMYIGMEQHVNRNLYMNHN